MLKPILTDSNGRTFRYLRLSITDQCNYRCGYCLPNGYEKHHSESFLESSEILNLSSAFSALGFSKIRITGGEPTLRRDFQKIISDLSTKTDFKEMALSTNGYRLKELVPFLHEHKVTSINVSIDSLNDEKFKKITGRDDLKISLEGIHTALKFGMKVKINSVYMKGVNDDEVENFIALTKDMPLAVRFIELMRTGSNLELFSKSHQTLAALEAQLLSDSWCKTSKTETDGPASQFRNLRYEGSLGLIRPYENNFCESCNRLRITSLGKLRLCLFGVGGFDLRPWLNNPNQKDELISKIFEALKLKPIAHELKDGNFGDMNSLSATGG